ncbi:MAG TPA: hypothetical protein VKW76_16240 [Candidatus Binatia bacterium]|nr:hypothetical protein [Candidatus Binatia bacterium]
MALGLGLGPGVAHADDVLHVGAVNLDPPTLVALGVQMLVSGDDNFNAQVAVRYRVSGTGAWRTGLPLFRVHPEDVSGLSVPPQFAGSIFDLAPGTTYDVELHATDPDGPVDQTFLVTGTTRPVPGDPVTPSPKSVSDAAGLQAALAAAQPGDVITLADGTYAGQFVITASGTPQNPIVIRGTSEEGTILDAGGCTACNVLESYGSDVHVERLTLAHANRGLRFQGIGADGNVVRRVHIRDVRLGIGSNPGQTNSYLCDNVVEGRLPWPLVYFDDGGKHADDDGIHVEGNGHVVCHNRVSGFGDALKVEQDGARANDFYGNEVLWTYDNAIELDTSAGNARCFRNRFTNTFDPISFQPIFGGPAYALRNVVVNVAWEQLKFHADGGAEPSGMLVFHNTFVSPGQALNLQTANASHHFVVENNLFVGPDAPVPRVVDWTGPIDDGVFDFDGWLPDGRFDFHAAGDWPSFAAMQAAGVFEAHGTLLVPPVFAGGLVAPPSYDVTMAPPDATLASASNAVDRGAVLPNVNDGFTGAAPDLGALEVGCPIPLYGVRPEGIDETSEPYGCGGPTVTSTTSTTSTTLPWVTIETTVLALRDRPAAPAARKVVFKALTGADPPANRVVPPAPGGAGDPTLGGGSLTVYNPASGEQASVPLPSGGWSRIGGSRVLAYRFRSAGPTAPVKSVVVKVDEITVAGGGTSWPYALATPPQGVVALRLMLGNGLPWCAAAPAKAPAARNDTAARFLAAPRTSAPATCPAVP